MRFVILLTILVFSVLCSREIILLNEELIVALSFLAFVIYVEHSFGHTVQEVFDSRANTILSELQQQSKWQEQLLSELCTQHHNSSSSLQQATQAIGQACAYEIQARLPQCKQAFSEKLSQQLVHKLDTLSITRFTEYRDAFIQNTLRAFREAAFGEFRYTKYKTHQPKLVKQTISVLRAI